MRTLKLYTPVERIALEIGQSELTVAVDLSQEGLMDMEKEAKRAYQQIDQLEAIEKKARENGDKKAVGSIAKKTNKVIEDVLVRLIGDDQLEAIYGACGCEGGMSPGTRSLVVMPLLSCIMECIDERVAIINRSKETIGTLAAHPTEGSDALPSDIAD